MGRRSSDTLLFPGSGLPRLTPEEPVYETDGIPVEGEGAIVRQRATTPAAPRRLRPADEARASRSGRTRAPRTGVSAADATSDLSQARNVSRASSQRRASRSTGSASRRTASRADTAARAERSQRPVSKPGLKERVAALPQSLGSKLGSLVGSKTDEKPRALEAHVLKRPWVVVLVAVLVAVAFLYAPVRDLYWARRDNEVLTAQAAALDESNAETLDRVQALSTEDGIKDEARLHGYVEEGEEAATVQGLPGETDESEAAPVPADVANEVLQQEDPWYVKALDAVFGYDKTARN